MAFSLDYSFLSQSVIPFLEDSVSVFRGFQSMSVTSSLRLEAEELSLGNPLGRTSTKEWSRTLAILWGMKWSTP